MCGWVDVSVRCEVVYYLMFCVFKSVLNCLFCSSFVFSTLSSYRDNNYNIYSFSKAHHPLLRPPPANDVQTRASLSLPLSHNYLCRYCCWSVGLVHEVSRVSVL